jgi:hypothetical protein
MTDKEYGIVAVTEERDELDCNVIGYIDQDIKLCRLEDMVRWRLCPSFGDF